MPNIFTRLQIASWRQFREIDIELHPSLTILTGTNGSGKSTLLSIFVQHLGLARPYLSTPLRDSTTGGYKYLMGHFRGMKSLAPEGPIQQLGALYYSNGSTASLQAPHSGGVTYNVQIVNQQAVTGFHVPSHRRMPQYQQVSTIPTQPMLPQQAYAYYYGEVQSLFHNNYSQYSPTYRLKEAILAMAILGPGGKYHEENPVLLSAFEGFIQVLRTLLPEELGFLDISIRSPDVVLITKSGDFLIDAASGGVMALIDLAWQIYLFSLNNESFIVTIDEPENHLHPSMQRTLMGNLVKSFPKTQFIIATHSPFVISDLKDAAVYVLRYEDFDESLLVNDGSSTQTKYVSSMKLDFVNRAGTADRILREVLGLKTTYPRWVLEGFSRLVQKYSGMTIDAPALKALREEVEELGFTDLYPDALAAVVRN